VASRPLLVLLAEDDDDLRESLAQILRDRGIRVAQAVDGQDAIEQVARGVAPCAILLDWVMPRLGGDGFLRARSQSAELSSIPVFVTSGTHGPAGDLRIQGCLSKPFDVDQLLSMLRRVCDVCPASRRVGRDCA
jgi:two-component system, chemotaxis family, sensor histidine kinase and response regulator PixL